MRFIVKSFSSVIDLLIIAILILIIGIYGLRISGIKPYIVVSGSMEPEISTGSLCFVDTDYEYENIRIDDVIAYQSVNGQVVTHRVIDIDKSGFETKGDNNDVSDGITTDQKNYIGKNIWAIPYLGYFFRMTQTIKGKILCITGGAVIILLNILTSELLKEERVILHGHKKRTRSKYIERVHKN